MFGFATLATLIAVSALAQEGTNPEPPPQRVRSVILYGEDKCPKAESADEVVICASGGESPYRIPKGFRESKQTPANTSWVRRAEMLDEVNRVGMPGSCSAVGTNGQTGCASSLLRQWAADRAEQKRAAERVP